MSKSLGNVSNLLDLIDRYDPRAYRMVLLPVALPQPDRRSRPTTLEARTKALAGLDAFVSRTSGLRERPRAPTLTWWPRSALPWTTTSTRRRATALFVRHGAPSQRRDSTPGRSGGRLLATGGRRLARDRRVRSGLELGYAAEEVPADGSNGPPAARCLPGIQGLRRRRSPSVPQLPGRRTGRSRPANPARHVRRLARA